VLLLRNSANTVFLLLMRATCSTIFISKYKFKISNMPTKNASYTYKIIKIHSRPKILKANQMLISHFPYITLTTLSSARCQAEIWEGTSVILRLFRAFLPALVQNSKIFHWPIMADSFAIIYNPPFTKHRTVYTARSELLTVSRNTPHTTDIRKTFIRYRTA